MNNKKLHEYIKIVEKSVSLLPDKPEETHENTVRALWLTAAGKPVSAMAAVDRKLPDLTDDMEARLNSFIDERSKGKPLGHITGYQRFMGIDFKVGPQALIPRKETEIVGYAVVNLFQEMDADKSYTIIDVCTGMGNLALAIASKLENVKVHGTDISYEAITLAVDNCKLLKLEDRVDFITGDLLDEFMNESFFEKVDVITCNPPYISTLKIDQMPEEIKNYEPREAFCGGMFGIAILSRLVNDSLKLLKDGGWLCFEVGLGQGEPLMKKIERMNCYSEIRPIEDSHSNVRALLIKKKQSIGSSKA
jgi:release factor glutamine methyltransferase